MTESMIDRQRVVEPAYAAGRHDHLRAACPRLHDRPQLGREASRDLRGPGREDRRAQGAGDHGRRAAAGRRVRRKRLRVRQSVHRRKAAELLGLQPDPLLRSQVGLCPQFRAVGPMARVLRHGRCVSRGGHRGLPRRRLQPHGRGGRRRARPTTSAASTTRSFTCSTNRAAT